MGEVTTIGLDLAKSIFQAHGADAAGEVVFRKKLRRDQMLGFFAGQPRCLVAMEACSGAHHYRIRPIVAHWTQMGTVWPVSRGVVAKCAAGLRSELGARGSRQLNAKGRVGFNTVNNGVVC